MTSDNKKITILVPGICTNCSGNIEVDTSQEKVFCKYCGTPFFIEKETYNNKAQNVQTEYIEPKNINKSGSVKSILDLVEKQQEKKQLKNNEVKKRQEEEKRKQEEKRKKIINQIVNKKYLKRNLVILGIFFITIFILKFIGGSSEKPEDIGKINMPASSSDFKDKNYQDVITMLKDVGFTNVETEILDDLITGWITKDGSVEQVMVDTYTSFSTDNRYPADAKIIVTYHTFPIMDESKGETEQESTIEVDESQIINEANATDITPAEDDVSQKIYEDAIGKPAIDIFNELKALGYNVSFSHAVTKMDFTSSVEYESDPTSDYYLPWIITDFDSYNATSKTASFYINTQEKVNDAQNKRTEEEILTAKLSPSSAWGAADIYGKSMYPYGFKLKIVTGRLAETPVDENTWFLKANCEVKNEYGEWIKNLVCEARISGTNESPKMDYFEVYMP